LHRVFQLGVAFEESGAAPIVALGVEEVEEEVEAAPPGR